MLSTTKIVFFEENPLKTKVEQLRIPQLFLFKEQTLRYLSFNWNHQNLK